MNYSFLFFHRIAKSRRIAQVHALKQFSKELESFMNDALFLSRCVKRKVLRPIDKENINVSISYVQKLIKDIKSRKNYLISCFP